MHVDITKGNITMNCFIAAPCSSLSTPELWQPLNSHVFQVCFFPYASPSSPSIPQETTPPHSSLFKCIIPASPDSSVEVTKKCSDDTTLPRVNAPSFHICSTPATTHQHTSNSHAILLTQSSPPVPSHPPYIELQLPCSILSRPFPPSCAAD